MRGGFLGARGVVMRLLKRLRLRIRILGHGGVLLKRKGLF